MCVCKQLIGINENSCCSDKNYHLLCLVYSLGGRAQIWLRLWSELAPVIQVIEDALLDAALFKLFLIFASYGE